MKAFILAMLNYPETIATARKEIDAVTNGAERLPNLEDTQQMPFVRAIVLEVGPLSGCSDRTKSYYRS